VSFPGKFKSCQPDNVQAGQIMFLSVTEVHDTGALDSVPTTARNRRFFPAAKPVLTCVFGPAFDPRMAARG
jgi:hypothetical protein